ncbi:selenium cofactor biosynthesis protein YqeC [Psychromonas sp. KJ10-10]|uniref:selenium cofactor biosynthesis protein YqeC n=1 Tax=Psychromonas sp. KJ10-10 TaxID=3391823 RepID=UPI0039B6184B
MHINTNSNIENKQLIQTLLQAHKAPITISIVGAGGKTHLARWLTYFFKKQGKNVCVTTSTKMYLPDDTEYDNIIQWDETIPFETIPIQRNKHIANTTFLYTQKLTDQTLNDPIKVKGLPLTVLEKIHQASLFDVIIVEADGANHLPIKAPAGHEPCIPQCSNIVFGVTGAEAIFAKANSQSIHRWQQFSQVTGCLEKMQIGHSVLKRLLNHSQGMFKNAPEQAMKMWVINKYDLATEPQALLSLAEKLIVDEPNLSCIWLTQLNKADPIKKVLSK